jgi:glycosyltransferase involved in cell wall biosynthesis
MNLLVLQSELGVLWGGGETFTTSLFQAFARRGHRVTATFVADYRGRYPRALPACFEPVPLRGWWSRKLGQATLSCVGERLPAVVKPKWDRVQNAVCWRTVQWHNQRFQRRVETAFADRWCEYDGVYVNGNVELAAAVARHRPTLLMLPGPIPQEHVPLLSRIHAVCAHDDGLRSLRNWVGSRALELPLGLDSDLFCPGPSPVRAELGWSEQDLVIGYVGRLALIKGVDLLAAAFAELAPTVPQMRLLVVGSGEELPRMRLILSRECARGSVHLHDRVSQEHLPAWYRAMDVLVMPSRYETMSNAVLEAMSCEVPFVASAVGGSCSLAGTEAGWLFEPESIRSLVDRLKEVVERRAILKAYGARGRGHVKQQYSWNASAERLERIIHHQLGIAA